MLNLEIAPQPSVPAIEPLVQRSCAEIIDRYRKFRAIQQNAQQRRPQICLLGGFDGEQAGRLGILRGRTPILDCEDELALVL